MNRATAYILALQNIAPRQSVSIPTVSSGTNVIKNNFTVNSVSSVLVNQASSTSTNFLIQVTGTVQNTSTSITIYIQYTDTVTSLITQQYLAQNQTYSPQTLNFPVIPISSKGPVQIYASCNPVNNLILNTVIGVE